MPSELAEAIIGLSAEEAAEAVRRVSDKSVLTLNWFRNWPHGCQLPPEGEWRTWVMMAGRGFGKTRSGAEWVLGVVRGDEARLLHPSSSGEGTGVGTVCGSGGLVRVDRPHPNPVSGKTAPSSFRSVRGTDRPETPEGEGLRIALVAATVDEARAVMVEGASGILSCARPDEIAEWSAARREVVFANGAVAGLFSGASPESLRGPEHDFAWCDELAKWRHAGAAWDNLQLGLRRGANPRVLVTTTPRAGVALARILDAVGTVVTGGRTRANPHLAESFLRSVEAAYAGTRQGAQELDGVMLRDVEGSLWPGKLVEACRRSAFILHPLSPLAVGESPSPASGEGLVRVVIGVDPPASAAGTCGIVVCGLGQDGVGVVLADASVSGVSPEGWARAVAGAATRWNADRIVVEGNQGGNMVEAVLRGACATLPIRIVHAKAGKAARAEPVAALFEGGRAVFAGAFPELEAELGGLTAGGYVGPGVSPDRADAMVWALWALMIEPQRAEPRVRMA